MVALERKKAMSRGRSQGPPPRQLFMLPRSVSPVLQRAPSCACGGGCPRCQASSTLKIGAIDDACERDADAVADLVMGVPDGAGHLSTQRSTGPSATHAGPVPPPSPAAEGGLGSQGIGTPLPASERNFFESRFGTDFSEVRVHTGHEAGERARAMQARAYTVGHDIVFGHGEYAPGTIEGRRLVAHELTHTLQQAAGRSAVLQRQPVKERLPELNAPNPGNSPNYIDNTFESVEYFWLNGATAFYWKENGADRKIVIPLTDLQQDETLTNVALLRLHTSKVEAEKTVQAYSRSGPGFDYYSFYTGPFNVILPTSFSKSSAPRFHAFWPALRKQISEKAKDIQRGLQSLGNAISPLPCTELDEDGNLVVNPSFGNCALPILLHSVPHIVKAKGGAATHAGEISKTSEQARAPAEKVPAARETTEPKPSEIAEAVATNEINGKQLAVEAAELRKNAADPAKVHQPVDASSPYDAEMGTSDGHEFHRDRKTQLWERCSPRPCKKGIKLDAETNQKVDAIVKEKSKPATPKPSPPHTAADVIASGNEPLRPGKSDLGRYGIDRYGTYSNRLGDKFAGHEMLQNLWLAVKGYGERLRSAVSRNNPAVALSHSEHVAVTREQRRLDLFDRDKLVKMSAEQVIKENALAMKNAGIPDYVIATLSAEALHYAATLKPPGQ